MVYAYLPYAIAEFFCIIFAVTILFRLNDSIGSEHEILELKRMVYAYLGYLATDMLWALNGDGIIVLNTLPNAICNAISIICITLGCFYWFKYVEDRLHLDKAPKRSYTIVSALPMLIICTLDAISIFTGWVFYIDANNQYQINDSLFFIPEFVNYMYLLVPTISALFMAWKCKSKSQKREYIEYPVFMAIPLACGLLEDTLENVPVLALSIFMVILIFFLTIQSRQVSTDALTGLNNRRRLAQFLENKLASATPDNPVALFMMDIDDFRSINDNFGHIEGDNALKSFAAALQLTATRYEAFVARYGEDEFCLAANISDRNPEDMERSIEITLQTAQAVINDEAKPYQLSISFGYAVCDHPETKVDAFIERANDVLQESKRTQRSRPISSAPAFI